MVPVSSCAFNVCGSYAYFNFFPYKLPLNKNVNALRLYWTDLKDTNICVKTFHWHKLWYNFPVVTQSCSGEQAVSFKKVSLLESLIIECSHEERFHIIQEFGCSAVWTLHD